MKDSTVALIFGVFIVIIVAFGLIEFVGGITSFLMKNAWLPIVVGVALAGVVSFVKK